MALLSDGEDVSTSLTRLMENQDDIGDLLRPFYPADQVAAIVTLLKDHIKIAGDIVVAAMADEDITLLVKQWRDNCQAIVQKLMGINPALDQNMLSKLWDDHLDLTIKEAVYRKDGNWQGDIENFDKILDNIQEISNMLLDGIMQQFPEQFDQSSWATFLLKRSNTMNRPAHPYWRRFYHYEPWSMGPWGWNNSGMINSQYNNTAQQIYNTGYMDGVNQISNVNQYQGGNWWG